MTTKELMTQVGYDGLYNELRKLKNDDRPKVIEEIAKARSYGDLKENAEYHAAREKQSKIEGRIKEVEVKLQNANIVDIKSLVGTKSIRFGATVLLLDDDTKEKKEYKIVGTDEADLEKGTISIESPLATQIIGKEESEYVEISVPSGDKLYQIVSVEYK